MVATYFSTYGGLTIGPDGVAVPAFAIPNPKPQFRVVPSDYALFLEHIPDEEFSRLVGAPPPSESISRIPFDAPSDDGGRE